MCGIAGIISAASRVNEAALEAMSALMAHRGPDGRGIWMDPGGRAGLAHRRLAVIDPRPCGAQPMRRDGLVLTYNGEIYNYVELREELIRRGHAFVTDSDTEVILAAWRQWGPACVEFFNGMFAFALWDETTGRLFCARDRLGEKPFLYVQGEGWFAFASEYRPLLALAGVSDQIDNDRLARFLAAPADGLDRGEATMFPSIRQLPPAHVLLLDGASQQMRAQSYWAAAPAKPTRPSDIRASAAAFRDLLTDSVRLRMRSDVQLGSCLSGGLDSGAIVCIARSLIGPNVPYHTFSGRFPNTQADEGLYMDAVAQAAAPVRHEIAPNPKTLAQELPDFAWANELPVDSASQYAQYCVFRAARRRNVKVLLDGQGADELLGGYEQYFHAYLRGGGPASSLIDSRYPGILAQAQPWHASLPAWAKRRLAKSLERGSDVTFGMTGSVRLETRPPPENLQEALRRDYLDGFLNTLLRYGDRNSMAHSVEVRLPFTDHRLFEFVQSLPAEHLMGEGQTKRLLREATAGLLPDMVRLRWRKQGFVPPQILWMNQGLLDLVKQAVESPSLSPLWDRSWWRSAIKRFQAGETAQASALWKVLATEAWREHFLGRIAALPKTPAVL